METVIFMFILNAGRVILAWLLISGALTGNIFRVRNFGPNSDLPSSSRTIGERTPLVCERTRKWEEKEDEPLPEFNTGRLLSSLTVGDSMLPVSSPMTYERCRDRPYFGLNTGRCHERLVREVAVSKLLRQREEYKDATFSDSTQACSPSRKRPMRGRYSSVRTSRQNEHND